MHDERHFVEIAGIGSVDDGFNGHVTQVRDLALEVG